MTSQWRWMLVEFGAAEALLGFLLVAVAAEGYFKAEAGM